MRKKGVILLDIALSL